MTKRFRKINEVPNLKMFDDFFVTPTDLTKQFSRRGGFKGTAVNTMYVIERLTERFGPFGQGWGIECRDTKIIPLNNGEVMVYALVGLWYLEAGNVNTAGYQWGGDYIASLDKSGAVRGDDEALKKAMTDGMLKCAAWLGIGADIHYGMHDDQKYLSYINENDTARGGSKPPAKPPQESAPPADSKKPAVTMRTLRAEIMRLMVVLGDTEEDADRKAQTLLDAGRAKLDEDDVEDPDERKAKGLAMLQSVIDDLTKQAELAKGGQ